MREGLLYSIEGDKELLVVPRKLKPIVLQLAHDNPSSGHLAIKKTLSRIKQRFTWPQMRKEVEEYCRTCAACQNPQINPPPGAPLVPMPLAEKLFDKIGIDIMGPLVRSVGGQPISW